MDGSGFRFEAHRQYEVRGSDHLQAPPDLWPTISIVFMPMVVFVLLVVFVLFVVFVLIVALMLILAFMFAATLAVV